MMEQNTKWIILLAIIYMIDHSFSAVFFPFELRDPGEDYRESKTASVHRGLLLSYSLPQKIQVCKDLFSADPYTDETTVISDGLENEGEPKHSLVIATISSFIINRSLRHRIFENDIFFKCSKKNQMSELSYTNEVEYFVSSAFHRGLMYVGSEAIRVENNIEMMLDDYIGMSPEFASLEQMELEKQYVTSRRSIRALRNESSKYVQMIEDRDDISELSKWQKFLLCSSIFLSPNYKKGRREYPWVKYRRGIEKNVHLYRRKCLSFTNNKYQEENWCTDCLYCQASIEQIDKPSPPMKNLILTRAYDDKYSLYVLIERDGNIFLKDYVKNVSILMNSRVPITDDPRSIPTVEDK